MWRKDNSCTYCYSNYDLSVVHHVDSRFTNCSIPAPFYNQCYYKIVLVPHLLCCWISYMNILSRIRFFLICIVGVGLQTGSTRHVGHLLAYCTCPGWLWGWRIWWDECQGKLKYSEKTCPDATLFTTNPTWPDPRLNSGLRGGKPATNRFSYGAAEIRIRGYVKGNNGFWIWWLSLLILLYNWNQL
jgi:hypothetical protein